MGTLVSGFLAFCTLWAILGVLFGLFNATASAHILLGDVFGVGILIICFFALYSALEAWRHLSSGTVRAQALGLELVSLAFALYDYLVFMDGLGVPGLNVNIGQGTLGLAIPLLVVIAVLASLGTFLFGLIRFHPPLRIDNTSKPYFRWFALFLVSFFLGVVVINPLTGETGIGVGLGILFGSFCIYKCGFGLARLSNGH
jgi:hypothetical protein